jgi:hypothetical protein
VIQTDLADVGHKLEQMETRVASTERIKAPV